MLADASFAPFHYPTRQYELSLQTIPAADLVAEIEAAKLLAADLEGTPGDSFAVAQLQLNALEAEYGRRLRLARSTYAPHYRRPEVDLTERIQRVKEAWPILEFCEQLLGVRPQRLGRAFKALCPLPGHREKTPSFTIYPAENRAWCFGCNRGGDVIKLTQYTFNYPRFLEALERLEQERR